MKKNFLTLLYLSSAVLTLGACNTATTESSTASSTNSASTSSSETATTESYEAIADYEELDYDDQESWELVAGKSQSPIDIVSNSAEEMTEDSGSIVLNYDTKITSVENNGHSIEAVDGGTAEINGRSFTLQQFHFHAASEHTINGEHFPIEAHFVHTSQDGRIAVIAVFFEEGEENAGFQEVLADIETEESAPISNITTMLPENLSYYHYLGSLTTPPLTENVEWYVMKNPVTVSADQIEAFTALYNHNNREVQPLNDRVVLSHDE